MRLNPDTYNLLSRIAREDGSLVVSGEPPFSAAAIEDAKTLGYLRSSPAGDLLGSDDEEYWLTAKGRELFDLPVQPGYVWQRFLSAIGFG